MFKIAGEARISKEIIASNHQGIKIKTCSPLSFINGENRLAHFLRITTLPWLLLLGLFGGGYSASALADTAPASVLYGWTGGGSAYAFYPTALAACSLWPASVVADPSTLTTYGFYACRNSVGLMIGTVKAFLSCPSGSTGSGSNCSWSTSCTSPQIRQADGSCAKPASSISVAEGKNFKFIPKSCSISNNNSISNQSSLAVGDPVNAGTGANMEAMAIYSDNGPIAPAYALNYISAPTSALYTPIFEHGQQWISAYDRKLELSATTAPTIAPANVYATRADGQIVTFTLSGSQYISDGDIADTLIRQVDSAGNTTGFQITNARDDSLESYGRAGILLNLTSRSGLTLQINRNANFKPGTITDPFGRSITFTYDTYSPKPRITKITQPDNGTINFTYDTNNNLSTVTWPDGKVRQYVYENSSLPYSLTGIIDENNNRFVTWTYDSSGRVTNDVQALGANQITLSYNTASTDITDSFGTVRSMGISTILNQPHSTGSSQPAGSGCAASASAITYDVNGNISSRTDFNGSKTTYVYDLARNLETSRTEGLTSAGAVIPGTTRTITTTWHATWHLPLVISEYTGGANSSGVPTSSTAVKQTTYTYDTKGNLSSIAVTDPALSLTRTTTITNTYSTIADGLILTKVVDGPRTDVSDITTYTYYPSDATCTASTGSSTATNLGCRGQLKTLTNELGQITTYDRYNHHGQLEKMTDPNGLITTNTYDARQRLLTQTVGTLTTSLQYDGVGQVTKLTLPDSSYLNYTYDAAHRLVGIADILNNTVTYTLDTEGNRISEQLKDPSGNLTKTLTRSYDALNRLQQLTGVGAQ